MVPQARGWVLLETPFMTEFFYERKKLDKLKKQTYQNQNATHCFENEEITKSKKIHGALALRIGIRD